MVTLSEFERVQELLGRPGRPRRKRHEFPYTGLIRCGECGFMVTAEHKVNRFGSRYLYYHCSKRLPDYRCSQGAVTSYSLEEQIVPVPRRNHSARILVPFLFEGTGAGKRKEIATSS
jgi:hypothetical protein